MAENLSNHNDSKTGADDIVDTTGLLLDYLANWKWFVLSIILGVGIAFVCYKRVIPVYSVVASVYLADENNSRQQGAILGMNERSTMYPDLGVDETEVRRLMSRGTVEPIVEKLGLSYKYYMKGFWPLRTTINMTSPSRPHSEVKSKKRARQYRFPTPYPQCRGMLSSPFPAQPDHSLPEQRKS